MKTTDKKIPAEALRFVTPFEFGDGKSGDGVSRYPVTITARTGKPIDHWYWGPCVHDLGGMQIHKDRLPIDYCHDRDQVLGFIDKFDASSGDLVVSGEVISTGDDRAAEIYAKGKAGVPFEASIEQTPRQVVIEEVASGAQAEVNGQTVHGPVVIFRKWSLRGVAVCPYGADMNTQTKFADARQEQVTIQTIAGEQMSEDTAPETGQQSADSQTNDTPADQAPAEAGQQSAESQGQANPGATDQAPPEAGQQSAQTPTEEKPAGQMFIDKFGTQGAVWFAQGKSLEEATQLHFQQLEQENADLKSKLSATDRGEDAPVSFADGETPESGEQAAKQFGGDENRAKFCTGIKVPTK